MSKLSETCKNLIDKLFDILDDDDFVLGVVTNAKNDENRQKIIDYIDNGDDVTVENIILLSLHLGNETE